MDFYWHLIHCTVKKQTPPTTQDNEYGVKIWLEAGAPEQPTAKSLPELELEFPEICGKPQVCHFSGKFAFRMPQISLFPHTPGKSGIAA